MARIGDTVTVFSRTSGSLNPGATFIPPDSEQPDGKKPGIDLNTLLLAGVAVIGLFMLKGGR